MTATSIGRRSRRLAVLMFVAALFVANAAPAQTSGIDNGDISLILCSEQQARVDGRCPATVVVVKDGWIVIESPRPLYVGERFYIFSRAVLRILNAATPTTTELPESEQIGTLIIEQVRGNQAAGHIVRNAYAEPGDLAVPTSRHVRTSLLYGARFPRTWRITADLWLGPLQGSKVGLGLVSRAAVEYRFGPPIKLALELGPGALVHGLELSNFTTTRGESFDGGSTFAGGLRGVLGLALSGFELSMGFGGAVDTSLVKSTALQMSVGLRAGSLDGLNMTVDTAFYLPALGRAAGLASAIGSFNIPVHRRVSLAVYGGGGGPLWAMGAFGIRTYLKGTGGPGTVLFNTSIGGIGMTLRRECPPLDTSTLNCASGERTSPGPLFQFGVDLRL